MIIHKIHTYIIKWINLQVKMYRNMTIPEGIIFMCAMLMENGVVQ